MCRVCCVCHKENKIASKNSKNQNGGCAKLRSVQEQRKKNVIQNETAHMCPNLSKIVN